MGDLRVVDLDMVDIGVIGLVVGVVGKDCLRQVEVVDEDYVMKVEVVAEGCLLDDPSRFSAYHQLVFDHQA